MEISNIYQHSKTLFIQYLDWEIFFFFLNLSQFNYFSITDSSIPLIHTWSLGVEEQFYFIFPFLIIISFWTLKMFKKKIENFYLVIFFLIIVSFLFFATNHSFWSHFYLPFSRAWKFYLEV